MTNALELLKELCRLEFCEQKAEEAASLLSRNVNVISTSDARPIHNQAQALAYLRQEVAQMGKPYRVSFSDENLTEMGGAASVACARVTLENDEVKVSMRVSASAGVEDGEKRIMFIHLSVADNSRTADESLPAAVKLKTQRDITDTREHTQLVEELLSSMNGGIATFRLENGSFYPEFVSSGVTKLLGLTVAEYKASFQTNIRASVYEADVNMLRGTVEEALRQNKSTSLTYRSPHKNGGYVWINGVFSGRGTSKDGHPLMNADTDIALCGQILFSAEYNGFEPIAASLLTTLKCNAPKYMVALNPDESGEAQYQTDEDGREYLLMGNGETRVYREYVGQADPAKPGYAFCTLSYYLDQAENAFAAYREQSNEGDK